jgi:hypothetical protein
MICCSLERLLRIGHPLDRGARKFVAGLQGAGSHEVTNETKGSPSSWRRTGAQDALAVGDEFTYSGIAIV